MNLCSEEVDPELSRVMPAVHFHILLWGWNFVVYITDCIVFVHLVNYMLLYFQSYFVMVWSINYFYLPVLHTLY